MSGCIFQQLMEERILEKLRRRKNMECMNNGNKRKIPNQRIFNLVLEIGFCISLIKVPNSILLIQFKVKEISNRLTMLIKDSLKLAKITRNWIKEFINSWKCQTLNLEMIPGHLKLKIKINLYRRERKKAQILEELTWVTQTEF